jgi:hypothetical protein
MSFWQFIHTSHEQVVGFLELTKDLTIEQLACAST